MNGRQDSLPFGNPRPASIARTIALRALYRAAVKAPKGWEASIPIQDVFTDDRKKDAISNQIRLTLAGLCTNEQDTRIALDGSGCAADQP
jgi:hypothetical protein